MSEIHGSSNFQRKWQITLRWASIRIVGKQIWPCCKERCFKRSTADCKKADNNLNIHTFISSATGPDKSPGLWFLITHPDLTRNSSLGQRPCLIFTYEMGHSLWNTVVPQKRLHCITHVVLQSVRTVQFNIEVKHERNNSRFNFGSIPN